MKAVVDAVTPLIASQQLIERNVALGPVLPDDADPLAVDALDGESETLTTTSRKEQLAGADAKGMRGGARPRPLLNIQRVATRHPDQPLSSMKSTRWLALTL
jgi:hypothetical protein